MIRINLGWKYVNEESGRSTGQSAESDGLRRACGIVGRRGGRASVSRIHSIQFPDIRRPVFKFNLTILISVQLTSVIVA